NWMGKKPRFASCWPSTSRKPRSPRSLGWLGRRSTTSSAHGVSKESHYRSLLNACALHIGHGIAPAPNDLKVLQLAPWLGRYCLEDIVLGPRLYDTMQAEARCVQKGPELVLAPLPTPVDDHPVDIEHGDEGCR